VTSLQQSNLSKLFNKQQIF